MFNDAKCCIEYFSEVLLLSTKCKLTIASFTTVLLNMNEVSSLAKTGQNVVLPYSNHMCIYTVHGSAIGASFHSNFAHMLFPEVLNHMQWMMSQGQ